MVSGTDAVVPFGGAVEDLNATIWQLNLQNLSEQILGFDAKMNELKNQEAQIKRILRETSKVSQAIEAISQSQQQAEQSSSQAAETQASAAAALDVITKILATASESEQKVVGLASVTETHEASIAASLTSSRDSAAAIAALEKQSQERVEEIQTIKESYALLESQVQALLAEAKDTIQLDLDDLKKQGKAVQEELSDEITTLVSTTKAALDEKTESDATELSAAIEKIETAVKDFSEKMSSAEGIRSKSSKQQLLDSAAEFTTTLETMENHYKEQFAAIEAKSVESIERNDKEAIRLTEYLAELEGRIHKSIERATGFTLFHSFQNRQVGLKRSANWWIVGLGSCVLVSAGVSMWLIHSITVAPQYGPLFFMKLAISVPLIFAITFCSVQYSRERRLEEEYAFKSSISISLEPYRKLVGELIDKGQPTEVAKYTEFLISSINRVFTSPTAQVFDGDENSSKDAGGLLKTAGSVAESLIKAKLK